MYDQRVNRLCGKIDEQRGRLDQLQTSSNELSHRAEDVRLKCREAESKLAEVESAREAERRLAQEEIERLKRSTADEVAKAEAALRARQQEKLGKLKQHCEDMKEVNRLTSLANQSGGIRAYLEEINKVGVKVSMTQLQRLADNKAKYIAELEKLDVVEVSDTDFQVTPPRGVDEVTASIDQYGTHMPPSKPIAEVSSGSESGDEDEEEKEEEGEVKDPSTGKALMPLDGNPIIPAAQP